MAFKMNGWSGFKKTKSYDQAYKTRDMSTYGNLSKSEYIQEAKRQLASKTFTGGYDAPKKQMLSGTGGGKGTNLAPKKAARRLTTYTKPLSTKKVTKLKTAEKEASPQPKVDKNSMTANRKKQWQSLKSKFKRKK